METTKVRETYEYNGKQYLNFDIEDMVVLPDDHEKDYTSRNEYNAVAHWGQRKLPLATAQLLIFYWHPEKIPNPVVVSAGAAPGINYAALSELFPQITWELYDPSQFRINQTDKIHLHNELFTDEIAQQWAQYNTINKNVFFLSDIRRDYPKGHGVSVEREKMIWEDMEMQANWLKIIKPVKGQLKFRLPYVDEKLKPYFGRYVKYLSGTLYKGIWAPFESTECRLVPDDPIQINGQSEYKEKYWDRKKHESQMFYFNTEIREVQKYINPYFVNYVNDPEKRQYTFSPIDPPELMNDYDSLAETNIWILYLKKMYGLSHATLDNVKALQKYLTTKLNSGMRQDESATIDFKRMITRLRGVVNRINKTKKILNKGRERNLNERVEMEKFIQETDLFDYKKYSLNQIARQILTNLSSTDPDIRNKSLILFNKYINWK